MQAPSPGIPQEHGQATPGVRAQPRPLTRLAMSTDHYTVPLSLGVACSPSRTPFLQCPRPFGSP